jgi:uncharacterized membrane protein
MNSARLALAGLLIIFLGFAVVAVGAFSGAGGSSSTGGFILIGPIPIIFGSGPNSGALASIAVAISVGMIVVYLVSFFFLGRSRYREAEAGRKSE